MRANCQQQGIVYQGFGMLAARQAPQVIYGFAQKLGIICLNGTCNAVHMQQDLEMDDVAFDEGEVMRMLELVG